MKVGIPYAREGVDPETGEPVQECPICGALCAKREDEDGETVLSTYSDHYAREHERG